MIFLIAGGLITMQSFKNYQVLNQEGLITTAYIIDLEVDRSGDSTDYFVRYQYTVPWNQELRITSYNVCYTKLLRQASRRRRIDPARPCGQAGSARAS